MELDSEITFSKELTSLVIIFHPYGIKKFDFNFLQFATAIGSKYYSQGRKSLES